MDFTVRVAFVATFVLVLLTGAPAGVVAQEPRTVRVGVYVSPPFVMEVDGRFTGMAIELWESVASSLRLQSTYEKRQTFGELLRAVAAGDLDVAVTNLTITRDRAQQIDFTHPWYDAGLRIMVNRERGARFSDVWRGLSRSGHLRAYAWLFGVMFVATVILTLFDRRFDTEFPRRWREGLAQSFHTVMSIAISGKASRKHLFGWIDNVLAGLWLVCGVALVAYVTSSITSVMTTLSLTGQITSLADLPGKPIGVFTGSVAEAFTRDISLGAQSFRNVDEAVDALVDGRIAAIVGDAPVLEYYAHTHPNRPVTVVGSIVRPDKYGFGLRYQSDLTRPVTVEILGAHERGVIERLRAKYFGDRR